MPTSSDTEASSADNSLQERITELALREFQTVLRENLEYEWRPEHGAPPKQGYVEQKPYSTEPWRADHVAIRAWRITPDAIEPLPSPTGPPKDRKVNGMFSDMLVGFFGITIDFTCVSINWQTGPRFGRGFVHTIEHGPNDSIWLGSPQRTWMS